MGTGPEGSGVTITPAAKFEDDGLSPEQRGLKQRRERRARLDAHHAADVAFQCGEKAEAPGAEDEDKQDPGPPENKAAKPKAASKKKGKAAS